MVGNESAQGRSYGRRKNNSHPIDCESYAALRWFKGIGQDSLLARCETSAANALQDSEEDEQAKVRRQPT